MRKLLAEWLSNPDGTPCPIRKDPALRKLSQEDIDVFLWVMAMAPKKELCRFRDLVFEVFLPTNGSVSKLMQSRLRYPDVSSLRESVAQQFTCPQGKTIGQVTQEDLLHYLVLWVGLKWE